MSHRIHKANARKRFQPRREPYWAAPLAPGRYIGFRTIDAERGSWIARARSENGPQQYNALGALTETFDYAAACKAAQEWFANLDAGVVTNNSRCTVEDACKAYVEDRRREKGEKTAADAEWRFKYTVYGTEFGSTVLARLRTPAIKRWREGLKLTKSGANRMMASLRAALNLAVDNRQVPATAAQEWRGVKQYQRSGRTSRAVP